MLRLKVNNKDTRTICEICSKITIKIPERRQWHSSSIFIAIFEHVIAAWERLKIIYCYSEEYLRTLSYVRSRAR